MLFVFFKSMQVKKIFSGDLFMCLQGTVNMKNSIAFAFWELKLEEKQTCRHSEKIISKRYYDEVTKVNRLKIILKTIQRERNQRATLGSDQRAKGRAGVEEGARWPGSTMQECWHLGDGDHAATLARAAQTPAPGKA